MQRHLGKFYQLTPDFILDQIGSTWVVTAAHCLYKEGELVAAKSLSVLLGLHDRSKKSEPKRCQESFFPLPLFFSRKQIPVDEIFVHENYTTTGEKVNDIALLRLGNLIFRLISDSL